MRRFHAELFWGLMFGVAWCPAVGGHGYVSEPWELHVMLGPVMMWWHGRTGRVA